MSVMPQVGRSLRETLVSRGRKGWKLSPLCVQCRQHTAPRGRDLPTGLCWFCRFPR